MHWFFVLCLALVLTSACTKQDGGGTAQVETATSTAAPSRDELIAKGKRVYESQCTQCHAPQPQNPGAVGPAIAGSSHELVEARVLSQSYPPGYQPKRPTKLMPALPFLKNDIDALAAYLQSVQ